MPIRFRRGPAIDRLRSMNSAFILADGEKSGPVLAALTPVHLRQVNRAFNTEGATTGMGLWPRLSARYAKWKQKVAPNKTMLQLTGEFNNLSTQTQLIVREYTSPNIYSFGFESEVGAIHERGIGKMPRRSILDKTRSDFEEFTKKFAEFWIDRAKAIIRNAVKLKGQTNG